MFADRIISSCQKRAAPVWLGLLIVFFVVLIAAASIWLLVRSISRVRYSFTESGNCRTDLWIKQLNAPLGEMVYEFTFDVKEKSGGAVTGAEVFVFDDVNRNGEIDTSDRAILEYHLPDGPPSSAVRCGPLKAQWRAQDVAFPYLLVTYEVNHSTTGRNLSALYDVANAPLPSSMPASARSSDQPGD